MQHNSIFFAALCLQRLPREIRVLLTHEDHSDLRRLASHADQLIAFGRKQDTVAAVINTPQEETVAAIQHKGKQFRGKNTQKKQPPPLPPQPASGHGGQNNQQQQNDNAPSSVGTQATCLCFYHWSFGGRANCQAPCSWQGN